MNTGEEFVMSKDNQFLTAQELVNLRKLKDEQSLPNLGLKYSACSGASIEEEELNSALASYKDILTQKRCSRICDLIQAHWDEDLKAVVTTKLKGKFVQHMGCRINDKVALSFEESLFLLENGCIEIMNGKTPMSTEEAYNLMLKEHLNLEKYQVYSHLSELGFIVVPHQKELSNQSLTKKTTNIEKKQRKRKPPSPLPENPNSKRLTFSGIFLEESDADKTSPSSENGTKSNVEPLTTEVETHAMADAQTSSKDEAHTSSYNEIQTYAKDESQAYTKDEAQTYSKSEAQAYSKIEDQTYSTNEAKCLEQSEKETTEAVSNSNQTESAVNPKTSGNTENKENVSGECQLDEPRSESVNSLSRCDTEDMEIDSHSADITFEESRENKDSFDAGSNSLSQECHIINSRKEVNEDSTSEVLCCSSSILNESLSEESNSNNLCIDDEVTLLEVKKKETTPLAVIDLLSDDEASNENLDELVDSDDDIKIIKVCNNPVNKNKSVKIPFNLEKIKSKKIQDCKVDASDRQSFVSSLQFPDIFRKDLVCVPRPPLNLLPLHVEPKKEAYILNLAKYSDQAEKSFQPPERLWNSYKDMQDYQRARRRNRQSDHYSQQFQGRDRRPWQKNFRQNNGTSREHRQTLTQNDFGSRHMSNLNHWNLISTGNRLDVNNYDSNYSQSRQGDTSYLDSNNSRNGWRHPAPTLDQKPNSPILFGNIYEHRNFSHHPYQNPQIPTEMHGTAYSYSTSMFASMYGQPLNFNNSHFRPFQPEGMISPAPFGSWGSANQFPAPNNRRNDYYHNGRHNRTNSFPCQYRHVNNKTSWNDVRTVVRNETVSSSNNVNEIEELPPDINEFLWNFSNISPLIKPGTKYAVSDVLAPLRLTHVAQLTDKNSKYSRYLPEETSLEITYDVYLPGTNFKKSCPNIPNHRIIVVRAQDPIPRYSEMAVLKKKWNDVATLQIAVVSNADIAFCCFNSICLPSLVPSEE